MSTWPPRAAFIGGPAALKAREQHSAAKWQRVRFRDNAEPSTRELPLAAQDSPREATTWMLPIGFWEEVGERAAWAMFLESHTTRGMRLDAINRRAVLAGER
jgi:hypothetical protein